MLQGHPSPFWGQLSDGLNADGHRVIKIHLCLADFIYWGRRPATSYRGFYKNWRSWIGDLLQRECVTDVLYYADRLPYHADTLDAARALGVACHAIEFGYLRPDWLTIEPGAMGALSSFPKDPAVIRAIAAETDDPDMVTRYPHSFPTEAFHEVTFSLLQAFGRPIYPFYNSDKVYWPLIDYGSWLVELAMSGKMARDAGRVQTAAASGAFEYNLIAMQLQADYQIRASSKYDHLSEFIEEVFASFAKEAPPDRQIVVKLHPLDNGLERWFTCIPRIASQTGIGDRVHVIKGGNLSVLLQHSNGVVLVNSTVAIHAMRAGIPVIAKGGAIFDIPGLAHQGSLDQFWVAPEPVDATLFSAFERALTTIQVKGSFYNPDGRTAAITELRRRFAV